MAAPLLKMLSLNNIATTLFRKQQHSRIRMLMRREKRAIGAADRKTEDNMLIRK